MTDRYLFQIRATGVLIQNEEILLVKQNVSSNRSWSLPGGRVEHGETIGEALIREIQEETGLRAKIKKLLYVCDKPDGNPPLIHITFLMQKITGELALPSNKFDENPIHDVKMILINDLPAYGFSERFMEIVRNNFPEAGSYQGDKSSIGL